MAPAVISLNGVIGGKRTRKKEEDGAGAVGGILKESVEAEQRPLHSGRVLKKRFYFYLLIKFKKVIRI